MLLVLYSVHAVSPGRRKENGCASNSRPISRKNRRDSASPILRTRTARRKLKTNEVTIFNTPTSTIPENVSSVSRQCSCP